MIRISLDQSIARGRFSIAYTLLLFSLVLSFITRLVFYFSVSSKGISAGDIPGIFAIGFLYDLLMGCFLILPVVLQVVFQNDFVYRRSVFKYLFPASVAGILLLIFTKILPRDFSPVLHTGFISYLCLRIVIYLCLYTRPSNVRTTWRKGALHFSVIIIVFALLLNSVSEWFFWNEFSSRYNFIAVDYLVYTSEVLGNIYESYPITPILILLFLICAGIVYSWRYRVAMSVVTPMRFGKRLLVLSGLVAISVAGIFGIKEKLRHFSANEYANSLAGNGLYEFAVSYRQNELNFVKYYKTISDTNAFQIVRQDLQGPNVRFVSKDLFSIEREINFDEPERKLNVVLISVESLSAEYMKAFGNTSNITPALDSLIPHSLLFTKLFASGNRTVRGLEALALSIPPTPGQSTVKRPDNSNLFSLGSLLKTKGYTTQYLYGGDSYFDNMRGFFSSNGYTVIDRSAIPDSDVHYQNIWGVADEDLFDLALHQFDANSTGGKPFFAQVMTVSNHRPYTYPEGRIDISPKTQTRFGAVKYTDYAIGRFLRMATKKSWFKNTIFVIVSDHCAGSAGSVELPVTGYHIPMLIYAPGIIQPGKFAEIAAQVDIAPTILGLLRMDYHSKFFGQDLFHMNSARHKAFISTYQGLGYLNDSNLVVQSPIAKIVEYHPDFTKGTAVEISQEPQLVNRAIAYYQCANWLLKNKKQSFP